MSLTSKERAHLRSLANDLSPVQYFGKASLTDENLRNVDEALTARELIKIGVLKNCEDSPREIAEAVAERLGADVVQVIGKKMVLYRKGEDEERSEKLLHGTGKTRRHNGRNI